MLNPRAPRGVLTRRDVLIDGESQIVAGRAVTTPERTAFDIGRRASIRSAVARLDALARATSFKVDDVLRIAKCHPGAPGLRQLETVLELVDPGAQSPRESYLRLLLIEAGLPRPQHADTGARRGRPSGRLPRPGLGGAHGRCRIRRRPSSDRPTAIRQRHSAPGDAGADGMDHRPGRRRGPPCRYRAPGPGGAGRIECAFRAFECARRAGSGDFSALDAHASEHRRKPRTCWWAAPGWPCRPACSGAAGWAPPGPGCAATPRRRAAARAR